MPLLRAATPVAVLGAVVALAVRLRLSRLGLSPAPFALPDLPAFDPDNRLRGIAVEKIGEGDLVSPECLVVVAPASSAVLASIGAGSFSSVVDIVAPTTSHKGY